MHMHANLKVIRLKGFPYWKNDFGILCVPGLCCGRPCRCKRRAEGNPMAVRRETDATHTHTYAARTYYIVSICMYRVPALLYRACEIEKRSDKDNSVSFFENRKLMELVCSLVVIYSPIHTSNEYTNSVQKYTFIVCYIYTYMNV